MKKFFIAAIISTFCFGAPSSGQDKGLQKEIEAVYAKRQKAILDKDFARLKSDLTADYTEKTKSGTIRNRREADADTDHLSAIIKEVFAYTIKVVTVEEGKDKAINVETTDSGEFDFVGPDNTTHRLVGKGRQRDTWIQVDGELKMKYHEELESTAQVDGKPVN